MKLRYRGGTALNNLIRRMRNGGNGDVIPKASNTEGVDFGGGKGYSEYSQDEGFQDFLRSTGQTYHPEYSGGALTSGGGSGSVRSTLGNTPYAQVAVNPELLPELSERGASEEYGGLTAGPGGSRSTRGSQQSQSAEMFRQNRQLEIDYEAWLSKQKGRPGAGKVTERFESGPGGEGGRYIRTGPGSRI